MHDHQARIAGGCHFHHGGVPETGDVVDDGGARLHAFARDLRMAGIDAHAYAFSGKRANHIEHAVELFFHGNLGRPGTRGFAAHVDNEGALVDHLACSRKRLLGIGVAAPIGKGVGGYIQDAHHEGHPGIEFAS